jgi:uncharacterized damage-inducible protein DinB
MTRQLLRQQLDVELALTREVLEAAREAPLGWKPHADSFSLGRLAMHVATIPSWLPAFAWAGEYDMGAGGPGPAIPASGADIMTAFEGAVARAHATLDAIEEPALLEAWTLLRDGVPVATMTRAEAISRYVVRHLVHHRGQLTVYLRLCGVAVPAIYGDSADRRLLPPGQTS